MPASGPTCNIDQRRLGPVVAAGDREPETCRAEGSWLHKVCTVPAVLLQIGRCPSRLADQGNTQEQVIYGQITDYS